MAATIDRRAGIGASEVPAILGLSPWSTPVGVWLEKVGLIPAKGSTGPMRTGTALEAAIIGLTAQIVEEKVTRNHVRVPHPRWPEVPLYATPDGYTRRRWAVVEVKLVGRSWADWTDGPPPYVQAQVQAQLACHPKAVAGIVGALVGSDLRTFELARDPEMVDAIETDVADWWTTFVQTQVAPPPDDDDDRWAVLKALVSRQPARPARIAADEEALLGARLAAALETEAGLKAEIAGLRLDLAEAAGEADLMGPGWKAVWGDRRQTDWAGIVRDEAVPPRIVEAHTQTQRVFSFRRSKAARTDEEATG